MNDCNWLKICLSNHAPAAATVGQLEGLANTLTAFSIELRQLMGTAKAENKYVDITARAEAQMEAGEAIIKEARRHEKDCNPTRKPKEKKEKKKKEKKEKKNKRSKKAPPIQMCFLKLRVISTCFSPGPLGLSKMIVPNMSK